MANQYSIVTELPNSRAPKDQLRRLNHRYHFASGFCAGKTVLEVACGPGIGLGYLARSARKVVGCDIDEEILRHAFRTYAGRTNVEVLNADAHKLPFEAGSFDVVIMYEAIYYLIDPDAFLAEARRVLKKDGTLILCSVNRTWKDFCPSPYSRRYLSSAELDEHLRREFGHVQLYGAFPVTHGGVREKVTSLIKRTAVALHLMPKTMKGKEWLKRIFFGRLSPLPSELKTETRDYEEPLPLSAQEVNAEYKVLYAVASNADLSRAGARASAPVKDVGSRNRVRPLTPEMR